MSDLVAFLRARLDEDEAWGLGPAGEYGHDPARVLREVEAKRRIVELMQSDLGDEYPWSAGQVLAHLSAVYSDHSDYRQEWKP